MLLRNRRSGSKKDRAIHELALASQSLGKALSLLGGVTRYKPKEFPPPTEYISRQLIESLITRLSVAQHMLLNDSPTGNVVINQPPPKLVVLRDEFERAYDLEREQNIAGVDK